MKKALFLILFLFSMSLIHAQEKLSKEEQERREKNIQAGNPFAKFGSKAPVATLSKGKYLEVHDLDSIVTIGSIRWHVENQQIVGRIIRDASNPDARPIGDSPGRWLSPDPLSEEFPSWSPYNFVMNNPIRLVDPDGKAPFDWVSYMGQNGQQQVVYDEGVKSRQQAEAKYKNVTDVFKSGSITGIGPQGNSYSYQLNDGGSVRNTNGANIEKGFTTPQGTYVGENKSTLSQLGSVASNSGDVAVVVGTVMVFTGVGAPIGAGLITYGGYLSTAGTLMDLTNDANNGNLTKEKFATKAAMLAIPEVGGAAFKSLGAPTAKNLFNLETIAVDKSLDLMRETKTGPYKEN